MSHDDKSSICKISIKVHHQSDPQSTSPFLSSFHPSTHKSFHSHSLAQLAIQIKNEKDAMRNFTLDFNITMLYDRSSDVNLSEMKKKRAESWRLSRGKIKQFKNYVDIKFKLHLKLSFSGKSFGCDTNFRGSTHVNFRWFPLSFCFRYFSVIKEVNMNSARFHVTSPRWLSMLGNERWKLRESLWVKHITR